MIGKLGGMICKNKNNNIMAKDNLDKSISRQIDAHAEEAENYDKYLKDYGGTFLEYRDGYRFFVRSFIVGCYLTMAAILVSFGVYFAKDPAKVYVTTYNGELHSPKICAQEKPCGLTNE